MDRRKFTFKAISFAVFSAFIIPNQSYACEVGFDDDIRKMGANFTGKVLREVAVAGITAAAVGVVTGTVALPLIFFSGVVIVRGVRPGLRDHIINDGFDKIKNAFDKF